jgi:hypothetical protein
MYEFLLKNGSKEFQKKFKITAEQFQEMFSNSPEGKWLGNHFVLEYPENWYMEKPKIEINPGDWVTLTRQYAKQHGESNLNNNYDIISKTVPSKHVYTNGDSIHEFGYDPSEQEDEG